MCSSSSPLSQRCWEEHGWYKERILSGADSNSYGKVAVQELEMGKSVNHENVCSVVLPVSDGGDTRMVLVPRVVVAAWFDLMISQPLCAGLLVFLGSMHKTYF